ncbi:MAG TPA: glycosyltransferase [Actinomycetota bacterium]|nr:glycosyltransferase [Actinomycetota bacterium]
MLRVARSVSETAALPAGERQESVRHVAFFVATVAGANASAYAFHVLMIRLLGTSRYGALAAIVGILTVTAVPLAAVQAVVAKRVANPGGRSEAEVVGSALRFGAAAAISIAVVVTLASPLLSSFLDIGLADTVLALAGLAVPSCLLPVGRGVLQGRRRFPTLGLSIITAMVGRLAFGLAFVVAGLGLRGAILALVIGEFVALAVTFIPLRTDLVGSRSMSEVVREMMLDSASAAGALTAFWTLVSIDVVLARAWLPADVAGVYATAAVVGKTVLYLPNAVALLVFPRLAEQPRGLEARRTVVRSLAVVAGVGVLASVGIAAVPAAAAFVFGSGFYRASGTAALLACSMTAFGAVHILIYYCLAIGKPPVKTLWAAVMVEAALMSAFHSRPAIIAAVSLGVGTALVAVVGSLAARATRVITLPDGELWTPPLSDVELSVVTPVYNGGEQVGPRLAALLATLDRENIRADVILVSDGSTDDTPVLARAVGLDRVRVVHYPENCGKGFALRTGMAMATGRHVAFIDSDGDLNPADLVRFLRLMPMYGADLVVGSKRHPLSEVDYPLFRRMMSWAYHVVVRVLFGVNVSDTQTGIKLVRREALAEVLPRMVEKRFAFDLELIVALRRAGHKRILEAPIQLDFQFTSTISKRAVAGIIRDTLAIWYRRFIIRQYDSHAVPGVEKTGVADVAALSGE